MSHFTFPSIKKKWYIYIVKRIEYTYSVSCKKEKKKKRKEKCSGSATTQPSSVGSYIVGDQNQMESEARANNNKGWIGPKEFKRHPSRLFVGFDWLPHEGCDYWWRVYMCREEGGGGGEGERNEKCKEGPKG